MLDIYSRGIREDIDEKEAKVREIAEKYGYTMRETEEMFEWVADENNLKSFEEQVLYVCKFIEENR